MSSVHSTTTGTQAMQVLGALSHATGAINEAVGQSRRALACAVGSRSPRRLHQFGSSRRDVAQETAQSSSASIAQARRWDHDPLYKAWSPVSNGFGDSTWELLDEPNFLLRFPLNRSLGRKKLGLLEIL
jgi:hypothetical protein